MPLNMQKRKKNWKRDRCELKCYFCYIFYYFFVLLASWFIHPYVNLHVNENDVTPNRQPNINCWILYSFKKKKFYLSYESANHVLGGLPTALNVQPERNIELKTEMEKKFITSEFAFFTPQTLETPFNTERGVLHTSTINTMRPPFSNFTKK